MGYKIKEIDYQPADLLASCKKMNPVFFPQGGSNMVVLGAFDEKEIISCIVYTFVKKGSFERRAEDGPYIERIATLEDYRGKGLATELIETCVRDARIQNRKNKILYGDPLDMDAVGFYEHNKIGLKEDTHFRNFLRKEDREAEKWRKNAIKDIKSGKERRVGVVDRDGKVVGTTSLPLSYLESFENSQGLEGLLGSINNFNMIHHDISHVEPEYFIRPGDLDKRKSYWKRRLISSTS